MSNQQIKILGEVVRVIDLEPIRASNGADTIQFRIEILRIPGRRKVFKARVWRKEFYRIQPTFPQRNGKPKHSPSDECLCVEDDTIILKSVRGNSINKAFNFAVVELERSLVRYGLVQARKRILKSVK